MMSSLSATAGTPVSMLDLAPFLLLMLAAAALWAGPRIWVSTLLLAIGAGYLSGALSGYAGLWIALLAIACLLYDQSRNQDGSWRRRTAKATGLVGIVVLSLALALHQLPGIHNLLIMSGAVLSPSSAPYDLWLNFDKTVAGVLILGLTYHQLIRTRMDGVAALKRALLPIVVTIAAGLAFALLLGYVQWAPKLPSQFALWAPVNLLSTCVSEEAFFRGFIQTQIASALRARRWGYIVAIASSALLFGLAHIAGGWTYVALAAAAGTGYAITFHRTQRIEMSILAHFGLNATHYLLFTYPYWLKH
jgi:membrane protease YdiL (CAAX protease family)